MNFTQYLDNSYVPYSNQPDLAVVRSREGRFFPGVRVENLCYPLTIGAIQNALFCCLSEGHTPEELLLAGKAETLLAFWEKEFQLKVCQTDAQRLSSIDLLNPVLSQEIDAEESLDNLLEKAVVPESNFPVSALLETETGYFSGVNVECSTWNAGLCAERIAIGKALSYGQKKFKKLYVHTSKGEVSSPCGACRQVIYEHMANRQIHLYHADHSESIHFSSDLLPHSFHSSALFKS